MNHPACSSHRQLTPLSCVHLHSPHSWANTLNFSFVNDPQYAKHSSLSFLVFPDKALSAPILQVFNQSLTLFQKCYEVLKKREIKGYKGIAIRLHRIMDPRIGVLCFLVSQDYAFRYGDKVWASFISTSWSGAIESEASKGLRRQTEVWRHQIAKKVERHENWNEKWAHIVLCESGWIM